MGHRRRHRHPTRSAPRRRRPARDHETGTTRRALTHGMRQRCAHSSPAGAVQDRGRRREPCRETQAPVRERPLLRGSADRRFGPPLERRARPGHRRGSPPRREAIQFGRRGRESDDPLSVLPPAPLTSTPLSSTPLGTSPRPIAMSGGPDVDHCGSRLVNARSRSRSTSCARATRSVTASIAAANRTASSRRNLRRCRRPSTIVATAMTGDRTAITSMKGDPVIANSTPDIASGATVAMRGNPGRGGSGARTGAGMRTTGGSIIARSWRTTPNLSASRVASPVEDRPTAEPVEDAG